MPSTVLPSTFAADIGVVQADIVTLGLAFVATLVVIKAFGYVKAAIVS